MKRLGILGLVLLLTSASAQEAEEPAVFPTEVTLARCKELALKHNPGLRSMRERIRQQEGVIVETRASRIPVVTWDANYEATDPDRTEGGGAGFSLNDQQWQTDIQVTYTLYGGGRLEPATEAARADQRAIEAEVSAAVNDLLLEVDRAYYGTLLAARQIDVQQEAVKLFERQLELARNRFEAGARPRFDVLQAEVALENAKPPLLRARNNHRIALDDLRRLVGLPFRTGLEPKNIKLNNAWPFPAMTWSLDEAVQRALRERPELLAIRHSRDALSERSKVARRGQRPSLDLFANYGAQSLFFSEEFDDYLYGWIAGAQARWPLFDGGRSKGRTMQAEAALNQTSLAVEDEQLRIEGEVRRAYFDFEVAQEILASANRNIEQAEEALRLANNRYQAGGATQLDVLQAQLETTRSRLSKVQADHDYHLAVSRLIRAVGRRP